KEKVDDFLEAIEMVLSRQPECGQHLANSHVWFIAGYTVPLVLYYNVRRRQRFPPVSTENGNFGTMSNRPLPPPNVPGNTEFERFDNAVRKMLTVSKQYLMREEAKWKRARKKRGKKAAFK